MKPLSARKLSVSGFGRRGGIWDSRGVAVVGDARRGAMVGRGDPAGTAVGLKGPDDAGRWRRWWR